MIETGKHVHCPLNRANGLGFVIVPGRSHRCVHIVDILYTRCKQALHGCQTVCRPGSNSCSTVLRFRRILRVDGGVFRDR